MWNQQKITFSRLFEVLDYYFSNWIYSRIAELAVESFEAQILYPKNYEQIDKMYAVHSLSFKVSDERFLG